MRASAILILVVGVLVLFGLVMLESTSGPQGEKLFGNPNYFTQHQVVWLVLGLVCAVLAARVDYHRWMKLAWPMLALAHERWYRGRRIA